MSKHDITILAVDDDPDLLHLIGLRLEVAGYTVATAESGEAALEAFRRLHPRVVITDLCMEGMDGHALFERLHAEAPSVPVIILTAQGTIPDAVKATQRGVFSFLTKPFDGQHLLAQVAEAVALSPPLAVPSSAPVPASTSVLMNELHRQAQRAAAADSPLLVVGPRGSGKKTLIKAIHSASERAGKPLSVLHCNAFTGHAESDEALWHKALRAAAGGSLVIGEVDQLPAWAQTRLLPLVIDRSVFPLFADKPVNTRVIAAASHNLEHAERNGAFRSDLFYALARTTLKVPALDEHREDIPLLVNQFIAEHAASSSEDNRRLSPSALALLQRASWPGNIRQLRKVVDQALASSVTPLVPDTLIKRLLGEEHDKEMDAFDEARRAFEYEYLVQLLKSTEGNVTKAARVAQRNRTEFYKLLARHQLDPIDFKK